MKRETLSERGLILAPRGRDAAVAGAILAEAGIATSASATASGIIQELDEGAAFLIVDEDALTNALTPFAAWLGEQEEWSDLPFIVLTRSGGGLERNPTANRYLAVLGNVTFLERPFHPTTLVSFAKSALRARRRQYAARARMYALRDSEEALLFLDRLTELVQPLTNPSDVMALTAKHLGEHLGAGICAYADMDQDQDGFTIRGNWTAATAKSIVGSYRLTAFGQTAVMELRAGRPLITCDTLAELGPEQASLFIELGLRATVCMPLVKEGRLTALMAVHSAEPRAWSEAELGLIANTTERSWAHVERVGAEAAVRKSEARFKAAVGAVQGLLWTNDAHGRMVGEQPGWSALTGQSLDEYQGYGWADAVHPADAKPTVEAWNAAVAAEKTFVFEHRVRRHDGEWRSYAVRAVPVFDEHGAIQEWVGVHTDVTEARRAEAALREGTQTLETLNRTGAVIAAELNLDRVVQAVTDAGVSLVGAEFGAFFYNVLNEAGESYMLYSLSGAKRSDFDGFGMPRATAVFRPTFVGEGIIRSDDILADPRYGQNSPHHGMPAGHLPVRSYLAVPVVSRSGEVIGGLFFGHAATARFTETHERLIAGIAGQAAVAIDNARLYQALQRSNDTLELRVSEEVKERAKTEEALHQAQKMEAIGQLTGGVAHDFNNLLTVIKSSTDLLRRPDLAEDRRRRYVDAISDTVQRASRLTSQLLAFARRQALKPEVFHVGLRIQGIAEILGTIVGSRIKVETTVLDEHCWIMADSSQFETAIVNLAVNARDAMNGEGRLTIKVRASRNLPPIRGQAHSQGNFVCISMSDTGSGIPSDQLNKIFEPFFTTKEIGKGTGLGLSQVFGFVRQSGGDVAVESEEGLGATFSLYLPRVEPSEEATSAAITEMESDVSEGQVFPRRVLIVEDNVEVGQFSTQILEDLGYETTLATNGYRALELLADSANFDVVFSDVVMPGMSGVALGLEIRRKYPDLPVVLTSGYSHVLAEEGRHGFDLLQKPYAAEDLSRALRKWIRRRTSKLHQ